jgi:hypothetical protein
LPVAAYAAFGTDRLLRGQVSGRAIGIAFGVLAGLGVLGAIGILQEVATVLAGAEQADRVLANAPELRLGAIRLLVTAAVGGAAVWTVGRGRLRGGAAAAALAAVVIADLWSIDRLFFEFRDPASVTFADDAVTTRLRATPKPFRVLDAGVYQGSYLMAHDIQSMLGYHGQEVRFYDELLGGKGQWRNAGSPTLIDLLAVRFILLPQPQAIPGFHQVLGPVTTTPGSPAVLLERDTVPAYARLVPGAAKLPDDQVATTVVDPRFPYDRIALYSDTASLSPEPIRSGELPAPSAATASVAEWGPGHMRVRVEGTMPEPSYLVIGETWYPDWHATVDGKSVPVLRADHALLSVVLPPGARDVRLWFASSTYPRGKLVTAVAVLITLVLLTAPLWRRRRGNVHA